MIERTRRKVLLAWGLGLIVLGAAALFAWLPDDRNLKACDAALAAKNFERAIVLCDLALHVGGLGDEDRARAFFNRGTAYFSTGNDARAIEDLNRALELTPDYAPAYVNRGFAHYNSGNLDPAFADFDRAIALAPENDQARDGRAVISYRKGEYRAALADLNALIATTPDDPYAYIKRASAHNKLREFDQAQADLDRANTLAFDEPLIWYARGMSHYLKGDYDRAIAAYDRALAMEPNLVDAYLGRGGVYVIKSDFARAMRDYERAVALRPDDGRSWRLKGMAEFLQAQYVEAAADFERAQAIRRADLYNVVLLHLARRHAGQGGVTQLDIKGDEIDLGQWPGPLIIYFLGGLSAADVLSYAKDADERVAQEHLCEAEYYLGQLDLAEGRRDDARRRFERNVATCPPGFLERAGAHAALSRM